MDDKLFQEFYCGNCSGYIRMRLNMSWDRAIWVECPNCQHKHERFIKKGQIVEDGRYSNGDPKEDLCPPKSAYSKEPITRQMDKTKCGRDGAVIKSDKDLIRDNFFRERWIEIAGRAEND